ncbi:hypothetical protein RIF29_15612 [Crotalaria pallida]|uniref:FAR1 domain-containing protein n=1 Tax=Crotalaria pallida TaxID=3830 RepID=A0AAN9FFC0_CROPI
MGDESFIEIEVDEDDVHSDEFTEKDEEYEFDEAEDFVEEDEGDEEHEQFEGRRMIIVDDDADIRAFAHDKLTVDVIKRIDFKDVEVAYGFYNEYNRLRGFSVGKHKTKYDVKDNLLWKSYVCSNHGQRMMKELERRRRERRSSRCECTAEFRVHLEVASGRWYVSRFRDVHNHQLVIESEHVGKLHSHRKITDMDIALMKVLRSVGIKGYQEVRWFKTAKEWFSGRVGKGVVNQSDTNVCRHLSLVSSCIRMCRLASGSLERYNEIKEKVLLKTKDLMPYFESIEASGGAYENVKSPNNDGTLRNPGVVRTKGCGSVPKADEEAEINGLCGGGDELNEVTKEATEFEDVEEYEVVINSVE